MNATKKKKCYNCNGRGYLPEKMEMLDMNLNEKKVNIRCVICDGTGRIEA